MEESDVIQLLRLYRHDLMNQLQIIQGYLSMGKPEIVKEKLATYSAYLHEEQKLMNMNAPSFTLWLLFFNDTHPNFRMTYDIKIEQINLADFDTLLTAQCKHMYDYLSLHLPKKEFYEGCFVLELENISSSLKGSFILNGDFTNVDFAQVHQLQGISQLRIEKTKAGMQGVFLLPLHNEVE